MGSGTQVHWPRSRLRGIWRNWVTGCVTASCYSLLKRIARIERDVETMFRGKKMLDSAICCWIETLFFKNKYRRSYKSKELVISALAKFSGAHSKWGAPMGWLTESFFHHFRSRKSAMWCLRLNPGITTRQGGPHRLIFHSKIYKYNEVGWFTWV